MAALAAVGFLDLRRKEPVFAWLALGMLVLPLLILVAMNYQYRYFSFRHLTFLLPAFMLLAGRGLFFLVRPISSNPVVAVLLFLLSLGLTLRLGEGRLFDEHSYMSGWKAVARSVAGAGAPGSPYLLPDIPSITELNWYLDAYQAPSSLRDQRIGPRGPGGRTQLSGLPGGVGSWRVEERPGAGRHATLERKLRPGASRRGKARPGRELGEISSGQAPGLPALNAPQSGVIADLPFSMSMDLKPTAFYRHLYQAQGVMLLPGKRFSVIASANDREGSLEYRFVNRVPDYPQIISLAFTASTQGPGNRLSVLYRFDSEPFQTAAFLDDPAAKAPRRGESGTARTVSDAHGAFRIVLRQAGALVRRGEIWAPFAWKASAFRHRTRAGPTCRDLPGKGSWGLESGRTMSILFQCPPGSWAGTSLSSLFPK